VAVRRLVVTKHGQLFNEGHVLADVDQELLGMNGRVCASPLIVSYTESLKAGIKLAGAYDDIPIRKAILGLYRVPLQ